MEESEDCTGESVWLATKLTTRKRVTIPKNQKNTRKCKIKKKTTEGKKVPAVVDLPTPPLPEAMAIACLIP